MEPTPLLTFRRIDLARDADVAADNHRAASVATFGNDHSYLGKSKYLQWLERRVEEFPDGCVIAWLNSQCVGQLELEVPYGLGRGYIDLFIVTSPFRGRGFGRLLNDYAERYFHAWEAKRVELHVSPDNERAVNFYRKLGYRFVRADEGQSKLWKMAKLLAQPVPPPDKAGRSSGG